MSLFKHKPCQVCSEKDRRIADLTALLQAQTDLVKWVISPSYAQVVNHQAMIAIDGSNEPIVIDTTKLSAVETQAMQMLTGDYN